jgi:hypothetical protein
MESRLNFLRDRFDFLGGFPAGLYVFHRNAFSQRLLVGHAESTACA